MKPSTNFAFLIIVLAIFSALVFSVSNPLVNLRDPGSDGDSTTTASDSGLEFINNELTIIRGCSEGERLAWDETADEWECGTVEGLGAQYSLSTTYVDGTGTAGADNTAQTVRTAVIPAGTLTENGDRIRIRTYWRGDTGGAITGTTTVNGVTIGASVNAAGGPMFFVNEAYLHYVTDTTANILETDGYPDAGPFTALSVAGFDWTADQDVDVDQDMVAANHIVVAAIFLDIVPKGTVP